MTDEKMSGTGAKIFATHASTEVSEIGSKTFETCVKIGSIDAKTGSTNARTSSIDAKIGEIDVADWNHEDHEDREGHEVTF